jgi:hypothetical protein
MMEIKAKAKDVMNGGLIASPRSSELARATGRFEIECRDKDGNLKWSDASQNLVVNVGLQYMAGTALTSTAQITTWYVGLYGAAASNTPAAGDTMSSHAGWTEVTDYSESTRVAATFAAATNANPSVVTNSASKASFTINNTTTVGGAFLTSGSAKSGTTGTLFSAADFSSPGDRSVVSGDILLVTYTFSLSA